MLHADPSPEAFRLDSATGRCGVIDWSYLLYGPLLYDLASAVIYVGGPAHARDLTEAYLKEGVLARVEVDQGLVACWVSVGRPSQLLRLAYRPQ